MIYDQFNGGRREKYENRTVTLTFKGDHFDIINELRKKCAIECESLTDTIVEAIKGLL